MLQTTNLRIPAPVSTKLIHHFDLLVERYRENHERLARTKCAEYGEAIKQSYGLTKSFRWSAKTAHGFMRSHDPIIMCELIIHYLCRQSKDRFVVHEGAAGSTLSQNEKRGIPNARIVAKVFEDKATVLVSDLESGVSIAKINRETQRGSFFFSPCSHRFTGKDTSRDSLVVRKVLDPRVEAKFGIEVLDQPIDILTPPSIERKADFFYARYFPPLDNWYDGEVFREEIRKLLKPDGVALLHCDTFDAPAQSPLIISGVQIDSARSFLRQRFKQRFGTLYFNDEPQQKYPIERIKFSKIISLFGDAKLPERPPFTPRPA